MAWLAVSPSTPNALTDDRAHQYDLTRSSAVGCLKWARVKVGSASPASAA